jgi:hypothetical protein
MSNNDDSYKALIRYTKIHKYSTENPSYCMVFRDDIEYLDGQSILIWADYAIIGCISEEDPKKSELLNQLSATQNGIPARLFYDTDEEFSIELLSTPDAINAEMDGNSFVKQLLPGITFTDYIPYTEI